jgi:hypothetical protein
MICCFCDKKLSAGDGYVHFRHEREVMCSQCHIDWFGATLREEKILRPEDIKPEDSNGTQQA